MSAAEDFPTPPTAGGRMWAPDFPFRPAGLPFSCGRVIVAAATLGIVFSVPGQTMGFSVFIGRQWLGAISGAGMASMMLASGVGPLALSLSLAWTENYHAIPRMCGGIPAVLAIASSWAANPQR